VTSCARGCRATGGQFCPRSPPRNNLAWKLMWIGFSGSIIFWRLSLVSVDLLNWSLPKWCILKTQEALPHPLVPWAGFPLLTPGSTPVSLPTACSVHGRSLLHSEHALTPAMGLVLAMAERLWFKDNLSCNLRLGMYSETWIVKWFCHCVHIIDVFPQTKTAIMSLVNIILQDLHNIHSSSLTKTIFHGTWLPFFFLCVQP
jgi:hypothetical protein